MKQAASGKEMCNRKDKRLELINRYEYQLSIPDLVCECYLLCLDIFGFEKNAIHSGEEFPLLPAGYDLRLLGLGNLSVLRLLLPGALLVSAKAILLLILETFHLYSSHAG